MKLFLFIFIFLALDGAFARQLRTTPAASSVRSANLGCNQGNISSLATWQQALMKDFSNSSNSVYGETPESELLARLHAVSRDGRLEGCMKMD